MKLFVREVKKETGNIVFSNRPTGPILGITKPQYLLRYTEAETVKSMAKF
jgi:hypothetical protein